MAYVKNCSEEPVLIPSSDYLLPGILHLPYELERPKPIVLLHGFTGNKSESGRLFVDLARLLCSKRYAVLRFDYRGHGDAPLPFEEFRISYAVEDSLNAIRFLRRTERVDATRVGVVGLSMGGGVGVKLAAEVGEVAALVLLSPALDFPQLSLTLRFRSEGGYVYFGALRMKADNALELSRFSVMDLAARVSAPTLIVHALDDEVVPISQAREFYEKLKCEKKFLEVKGGHVFNDFHVRQRILKEVVEWFEEHL